MECSNVIATRIEIRVGSWLWIEVRNFLKSRQGLELERD